MRHCVSRALNCALLASLTPAPSLCRTGTIPGDESALDLLPAAGLVTSSEDYYPTGECQNLLAVGGRVVEAQWAKRGQTGGPQ